MKYNIITTMAVSDELSDSLSTIAIDIHNLHRTGPWMHVDRYEFIRDAIPYRRYSVKESPIYAAHCERNGRPMWIVLQPKHPNKSRRFFFCDREGGAQ